MAIFTWFLNSLHGLLGAFGGVFGGGFGLIPVVGLGILGGFQADSWLYSGFQWLCWVRQRANCIDFVKMNG